MKKKNCNKSNFDECFCILRLDFKQLMKELIKETFHHKKD